MAAHQQQNGNTDRANQDADFAQAFKDLQRGEATAAALENHLGALEKKIDELLASAEENQTMADRKAEASETAAAESSRASKDESGRTDKSNA